MSDDLTFIDDICPVWGTGYALVGARCMCGVGAVGRTTVNRRVNVLRLRM
jgi:hypothetical protein